jgi:hypothetical protein
MLKKSFWSDGLSVSESRVSIIVLAFVAVITALLYVYLKYHEVNELILDLTKFMIGAITGINVTSIIGNVVSGKISNKNPDEESQI